MKHRKSTMPIIIPNQEFYNSVNWFSFSDNSQQMKQWRENERNKELLTLKPAQLPDKPAPKQKQPPQRSKTRIINYKSVRTINN